ncbi:FUSC family protein [Pseudomonas stutzeri]|uniref:FUSC family protein n=1 Tax=Stutzerimonas stutzeri TaxID=316 RepID=UPI00210A209B|nr:FUSC family protein [Stutzerimonas stutzeri]MCQ4288929.1 FUSC family protein [Stutzerimonas stutzeri]
MNMPTWREWLFSAKALTAALLSLYIALAIPLDNPYWAMASVYVVSHPLSGATRSKALYRALGTLLGAAASVAILPLFGQQPVMLSLVISLWLAALLYLSLIDRSPRSYVFMLAAYTVPLISLTEVNAAQTIFDVALARSEEILLGIVCASLVNAVLFPSRIAPVLNARMAVLLADARAGALQMLSATGSADLDQRALHQLMIDVMGLDGMIVHLEYDADSHLPARHAREFRARMAMLAPQLISIGDALRQLRQVLPEPLPEFDDYLQRVGQWLQDENAQLDADGLVERSWQLQTWLSDSHPEQHLALAGALGQLRALIALWQDALELRRCFAQGHPEQAPALRYRVRQLIGAPRHYDYPLLAFSALSAGVLVLLVSLLWYWSGWAHGYTGVFLAAVASCFFAGQDNPAPFIKSMLVATLISTAAAAIYLFALMPNVHDFGSLAILLAAPLLLLGTFSGRPQYAGTVVLLAVQTISTLTIQDRYSADFSRFADVALSSAMGVTFALIWAHLTRPFGTQWAARRLARSGWITLSRLTLAKPQQDHDDVASKVIDRTAQLLPRLAQLADQGLALHDATRGLRLCFRLLELKRRQLPADAEQPLQSILLALHDYFQACARTRHPELAPDGLRQQLDDSAHYLWNRGGQAAHDASLALHGLRLALFPADLPTSASLPTTGHEPLGASA